MYLNVYQLQLQSDRSATAFFRFHRDETFPSSALMNPTSKSFIAAVDRLANQEQIPLITFNEGRRKDDVTQQYQSCLDLGGTEGIAVMGKARKKTLVFRAEKRRNSGTAQIHPWIVRSTAIVNHHYFYGIYENFGFFFLKFCTYFPCKAELCINEHEYVKRQLSKEGTAFEALDNGVLSCADLGRLQQLWYGLSALKINALLRKWLARIPHLILPKDQAVGYGFDIAILQAVLSLTQILDRPQTGCVFFEEVIRMNLGIGRLDHVQLIFDRQIAKRTPGRFRTWVITEGATPSLHFDYKYSRIKQYHKEGRALRTETTVKNPRDFDIGKRLSNLSASRRIGIQANRRVLDVQRISQDCSLGKDAFHGVNDPIEVDGQHASGLRFADVAMQALLSVLLVFRVLPRGFSDRDLRDHRASPMGKTHHGMTRSQITYRFRRPRLNGVIERIAGIHCYRVTRLGWRTALYYTRRYNRILWPSPTQIVPIQVLDHTQLLRGFDQIDH